MLYIIQLKLFADDVIGGMDLVGIIAFNPPGDGVVGRVRSGFHVTHYIGGIPFYHPLRDPIEFSERVFAIDSPAPVLTEAANEFGSFLGVHGRIIEYLLGRPTLVFAGLKDLGISNGREC
jgi:hypothetical protein|tara:strand:- start:2160 stop:2519 length:360 start_codon:yes stop_codon:yes gene_type:complete